MQTPVATVNGQQITRFELETSIQEYALQLQEQTMDRLSGAELADLKRVALEKLIVWELIRQDAEQQRVVITDEDVAEEADKLIGQLSSEEDFFDKLASRGVDMEVFRHSVRREMTVQEMTDRMVAEAADPTPAEVEEEYRRYLEERKDEKPLSLEEATPKIRSFLKEKAGIGRLRGWVAQLRSLAAIETVEVNPSNPNGVAI